MTSVRNERNNIKYENVTPARRILSREEYLRQKAASNERLNIRLTNNYAFRKIFKNEKVAKGFLMALLHLEEDKIAGIQILDPFEEGETEEEKEGILDIKLFLKDGQKINIEMQNRYQEDWEERCLFYNCRMFAEGFAHGRPYGELERCIHVGILDFNQMVSRGFHHSIFLMDRKTGELFSSKFVFHVIELKKLKDATKEEKEDPLYRWAKFIASENWEALCMEAKGNAYMEAARDELDKINQSETERWLYLRREMAISDEKSRMLTALHQGEKIGKQIGEKIGEKKLLITQVCKKLRRNKSPEDIAESLEADISEIEQICEIAKRYAPEYDSEQIYEQLDIENRGDID